MDLKGKNILTEKEITISPNHITAYEPIVGGFKIHTLGGVNFDVEVTKEDIEKASNLGDSNHNNSLEYKIGKDLSVRNKKFRIDILKSNLRDGISYELILKTNFVLSGVITEPLAKIEGIESINTYSSTRYQIHLRLGTMFDIDHVEKSVCSIVEKYLSEL